MLPRFRHILVPVDFTLKNQAAVDIAFEMAVDNKARVSLFHAIETIDAPVDEETEEFYNRLESRAAAELETLAQRFLDAGLGVDRKVHYGKRALAIVEYADERGVDLIVMSSHKIDIGHLVESWGTISYQVSVLCGCPVLLVK